MELIESVRRDAAAVLIRCCHPSGLKASGGETGHHQVWARDTGIALLGARFVQDSRVQEAIRTSLRILRENQAPNGQIPNNVDAETGRPNFRAYADAGLWWILGSSLVEPDPVTTDRILDWCASQDTDQSGLLSMQEAADWQDLFCTRGKGLYLNCLYVLALEAAGRKELARRTAERVNAILWYRGDGDMLRHFAHTFSTETPGEFDSLGRKRRLPPKRQLVHAQYYLPYVAFRTAGEWFDSLGNLLAILCGATAPEQSEILFEFIERHGLAEPPMRALYPAIEPGDADWRDYYGSVNQPHQYHNGGVWPFLGGFYIAALVKHGAREKAARALERLAELNRDGQFNEWHHGQTLRPMGVEAQAWSAGAYLWAYESVMSGRAGIPGE